MIGKIISNYRILQLLGRGGMAEVYKAEDTKLRRAVALKFPLEQLLSGEFRERFEREAQAAATLDHPNICPVYEFNEHEGRQFIAMAYVDGGTVRQMAGLHGMPLAKAVDYAVQAASGLGAAHRHGIVHRDIKSANLMLTSERQVKIMDFGVALLAERSRITRPGTLMGTACYMSPEQALCQPVDRRADIWSLGVVLYEMISGNLPFGHGPVRDVVSRVVSSDAAALRKYRPDTPAELDRIVKKALSKKPGERYQYVDDFIVDLRAVLPSLPPEPTQSAPARGILARNQEDAPTMTISLGASVEPANPPASGLRRLWNWVRS